jgi:diadenosine tetraphosphatase ApaH/serine/threonine PP2A family protein phosphatase
VISDIHSNLHALEVVLDSLEECERVLCLGDVVGYGAFPNECVNRTRRAGAPCVLGNHDAACIGLLSLGWFNPYAAAAARWTTDRLTSKSEGYLRGLPRSLRTGSLYLVHGSPREPTTEYLTDSLQARDSFALAEERLILVGHTHVPLAFMERDGETLIQPHEGEWLSYRRRRLIFNPGSVGQPRDGDPRASYALIDSEEQRVCLFRVEYDLDAAASSIIDAGLPRVLADRLGIGR